MITTAIHFDFGGRYEEKDDGIKWNEKGCSYRALPFKTTSLEEITYSVLEEKVRKKIGEDKCSEIRMSYIPLEYGAKQQLYICDDEDVRSFLYMGQVRSLLHVEIVNNGLTVVRGELRSSVGKNYAENEIDSNGRDVTERSNALEEEEEQHDDVGVTEIVGVTEYLSVTENVDVTENVGVTENIGVDMEMQVVVDGDVEMNEDVNCGIDQLKDVPLSCEQEVETGSQYEEEWDDGMGLEVGQEFESKGAMHNLLLRASNQTFFSFIVEETDTRRYIVKCSERGCKWYLRMTRPKGSQGSWELRVYRRMHSCSRVEASSTNYKRRRGTACLVADVVQTEYRGRVDTPVPKSLILTVKEKAGVMVSYSTAWRGKNKAAYAVRGNPVESYKKLPLYLYMLEKVNPGTVTELVLTGANNTFQYLFIALGACVEGFKSMRKVLSVDAAFLKTVHGGAVIFAIAQDPNHHHYPIAFAIVDGENIASWNWFFTMLKRVVADDPELVFLSDRNAGLIKGIRDVYPRASHGYCFFHLSQNVRTNATLSQKETVAKEFRKMADIPSVPQFEKEYEHFRRKYPKTASYLDRSVEIEKWARCYFGGCRYNLGTTNITESVNGVFREERKLSLVLFIDAVIDKVAEWFNENRKESLQGSPSRRLVPFVENDIAIRLGDANHLVVQELNVYAREYSVIGGDGNPYLVNLRNKTCACRYFDLDQYPCVHAVAAVLAYRRSPEAEEHIHFWELCSKYYLKEMWQILYERTIYPVPPESQWFDIPDYVLQKYATPPPPPERKGRLKVNRYPSVGERRRKPTNKLQPGLNLDACFNSSS